jgi:3D-(3,5/4)-trihydroxycyclohexane-1,2-dione acylhydrolase (decyclizing)
MSSLNVPAKIRLTMAQALVKYLQAQFSERDGQSTRLIPAMFGIFGHGNVAGLGQALVEYGTNLPYYQPCNEQSMVHTAIGFAKAKLRLSTLACTSSIGPGATNMVTGAALATINRIPVLLLPSDYYATRHQGAVLQQLEHPISADESVNDCFRPVSRFFDRISRPEQLLSALPEAMRVLTDPAETGAVTLAIPQDVQAHAYDYPSHFFERRTWSVERRLPDQRRLVEAAILLKEANRPFIIAGGGVLYSDAGEPLQKFAEAFGIPVGETSGGKGSIRSFSPLHLGGVGVTGTEVAGTVASQADLVICVGTRLTDFTTGSQSVFQNPHVKFISINVCAHDANKQWGLPIVGDARATLELLDKVSRERGVQRNPAYVNEVAEVRSAWHKKLAEEVYCSHSGELMSQGEIVGILNKEARAGDTVLTAAGSAPADLLKLWDATEGRGCHLEFGFSCMGYEIPASLGVRMAQPVGEIYVVVGDGTYLMNPTEIVTAVQEGLKVTVVLIENHGYQCIRSLQLARAGHSFGNEFRTRDSRTQKLEGDYLKIDFARNAASLGARTWRVATPEQLKIALSEAREESGISVIVVETEPYRFAPGSGVWWDVAVAEVSNDAVTQRLRAEYEKDRDALRRFYY